MADRKAPANRRLRVVLLGAGALGHGWSKVVADNPAAELSAIVDPLFGSPNAPAWIAEERSTVPAASALAGLGEVPLDAAVVTAQSPAHAAAIRAALEHGLHVIVEKPFVTSLADAQALVDLAASRGLTLMVSQNYRFFPGVSMIRELVTSERFGRIRAVVGQFWCDWPGKPYQLKMQHVMGLEMAVHHFDLARAFFDADAVAGSVREWNPAGSQYAGGGALEALFELRSAKHAFPFLYTGSLVGRAPRTPWGGHWRFELDRATVVIDTIAGRYGIYRADVDGYEWLGPFADETMHFHSSFAHFVDALKAGRQPWSTGKDNLGTLKMVLDLLVAGEAGAPTA